MSSVEKQVIRSPLVPETGGPFNLAVRHGCYVYISGLPPFEEDYCRELREARAHNLPLPSFPDLPFEQQTRIGSCMANQRIIQEWANAVK
jgi:hypothetical protein